MRYAGTKTWLRLFLIVLWILSTLTDVPSPGHIRLSLPAVMK